MRELHAIGLTPDGQHLLLAATPDAAKASHRIAVDQRFEAALRGQRVNDPTSGPSLSVQDMQARLRSGSTVEEVAAAAGLPVSRVERFAGPVFSERESVLTKIFAAHQSGRRGHSTMPLGRAVAIALEDVANVRLDTVEWTAYRKADGVWVGRVSVFARGRVRRAEWSLDDVSRTVRPLDAWASSLGHLDDAAKPVPVAAAAAVPARATKKPTPRVSATRGAPARPAATKTAAQSNVAAPQGRSKAVPGKPAANRGAKAIAVVKAPARARAKAPAKAASKGPAKAAPAKAIKANSAKAAKSAPGQVVAGKSTPAKGSRTGNGARASATQAAPVRTRSVKATPDKAVKATPAQAK